HDSKWSESGCNTFATVFGYETFSFNFNGVQFIGTNSGPNMRMAPALVPRESMMWLDSVTASLRPGVPVVFVNHYPLDDAMLNYEDVLDMLRRTNIQFSMCGHGHNNRVLDFSGVRGIMGRSNLRAGKVAAGAAGYNVVTVAGDSVSFAVRSGGVTQEPWHTLQLFKRAENPAVAENIAAALGMSQDVTTRGGAAAVAGAALAADIAEGVSGDSPVSLVWEFQDNSDIGSAPYFAFDMVFISNTAGFIKALDIADGSVVWSFATGGKVFSSPEVDVESGVLVVGSTDNFIYGLDARSGELLWRVEAAKSVLGSPAIYKGVAYIGASDGVFRAIDVATGKVVWSYDGIRSFVEARPWVDDDGVYIGDWGNRVYAFDIVSGSLQWEWTNRKGRGLSAAAVWPVKAKGKVFVVTPERRVHAIDAVTGREVWSERGGREAIGLSEDGAAVYIKTMQDTVIAFSTTAVVRAGGAPRSGPVAEELSRGGDNGGSAAAFSFAGSGVWPGRAGGAVKLWESHAGYGYEIAPSPITAAYGLVFIPTDKGNIFALNAGDGSVAWSYRFSIALINYVRPIGDGRLLVSSMDGKVGVLSL
ncbi:MAG: PQQ-binding-like beta-propeller repeat protein, partial [Methylophilaceae bacterium]|nr:PQQ-binding-like beta-propeller repeat protein [Methylophilaceae bacterium]